MNLLSKSARSTVVGFAVLTVLLTAGAAQGLSGTNTVDSGDIIDGQVKFPDIAAGAVTFSRIAPNAVTQSRIANNGVSSSEIADFTLSNQDVGVLFAQVNADGTVFSSSGGVSTVVIGLGTKEVDFGRNVSACAAVVTQGEGGIGGAGGAITGVTDRNGNAEAFFVTTRDPAGALVNTAFQIVVVC